MQAHIGTQTCGGEKVRKKQKSRFSSKDKQRTNSALKQYQEEQLAADVWTRERVS